MHGQNKSASLCASQKKCLSGHEYGVEFSLKGLNSYKCKVSLLTNQVCNSIRSRPPSFTKEILLKNSVSISE